MTLARQPGSRIGVLPVRWPLAVACGLPVVGFLVMGAASTATMFPHRLLRRAAECGDIVTLLVWAMTLLSFQVRACGAGLWQSAFALGQFLCPVVVTFLAGRVGGLLAASSMVGLGALIASPSCCCHASNAARNAPPAPYPRMAEVSL